MTGIDKTERAGQRAPRMLMLIALIGAALSFYKIAMTVAGHLGWPGGIATAILFDAAMWLSARWYIATVRAGHPLRPALWLSMALIGATLWVNIDGSPSIASAIWHGIGPAVFAAFTWIEAAIETRAWRQATGARQKIPPGEKLIHPGRALRVYLMQVATGTASYTTARRMCQNRESRRRIWKAEHGRRWRSKVDPVAYTAYRWSAITADAHIITGLSDNTAGNVADNAAENGPRSVSERRSGVLPTPPGNDRPESPPALPSTGVSGRGASGGGQEVTERGMLLPEGVTGRSLSPADLAALIDHAGLPNPSVRQVIHGFAVSYDKATKALSMVNGHRPGNTAPGR